VSKISIIIPCLNEEKYIVNCIESIIQTDINHEDTDKTVEIINRYIKIYPFIKVLLNPEKHTPISMNIGIKASMGEYIFILSAHALYERDYFSKLVLYIKKLKADCVGGVLITDVKNRNTKSNSIKEILTHKLGVGNSDFRTGIDSIKKVDTVAFACYLKSVFEKYGYYDERLIRNQDIELNKRIINAGGSIYLLPDVKCTYYARENFTSLAKNNYGNGFWNILTAYYTKTLNSLSLRHFIPLLFILSLLVPLSISLVFPKTLWIVLFSLVSYLSLVIIISLRLKNKSNNIGYLIISFLTLHFSYGVGSLMGIFTVINKYIKGEK